MIVTAWHVFAAIGFADGLLHYQGNRRKMWAGLVAFWFVSLCVHAADGGLSYTGEFTRLLP